LSATVASQQQGHNAIQEMEGRRNKEKMIGQNKNLAGLTKAE